MKNLKKLTALILVVVMVFAMSSSVLAANYTTTDDVKVVFTKGFSFSENETYTWNKNSGGSYLFGATSEVTAVLKSWTGDSTMVNLIKDKYYEPADHAMRSKISVLDVVISAALTHQLQCGWNAKPEKGEPGGYLYNIDNNTLRFEEFDNGDGTREILGDGFVIAIGDGTNPTTANVYFPETYLSNVEITSLPKGSVIFVDLGMYHYDSVPYPTT